MKLGWFVTDKNYFPGGIVSLEGPPHYKFYSTSHLGIVGSVKANWVPASYLTFLNFFAMPIGTICTTERPYLSPRLCWIPAEVCVVSRWCLCWCRCVLCAQGTRLWLPWCQCKCRTTLGICDHPRLAFVHSLVSHLGNYFYMSWNILENPNKQKIPVLL